MGKYKGQMVFEFVIATVLFIGVVFYVIFIMNTTMSSYVGSYYKNHLQEEALRVSELLVHSQGVWEDAGGGNYVPKLPGLAISWPVLDDTKIEYLSGFCSLNQETFSSAFGLDSGGGAGQVRITISNASGMILSCSSRTPYSEYAYAERFAFSGNSGLVKVGVSVW